MDKKNKTLLIVFGIFALVIVTTAASYAFFTYSRVGNTTTTITSGDIEFSFIEGEDASLATAFPLSDSVGANDTTEEYTFTVNLKSSSASNKMNYNVYLLDANDDENANYFTNEQIKFALVKDGTFVAGTSSTSGVKLTDITGFTAGEYQGEGIVLENQEITPGKTDEYKLRIWISDDVNYSNTEETEDGTDVNNDTQISSGKYNGYKYSLRVKVTSGYINGNNSDNDDNITDDGDINDDTTSGVSTSINNLEINKLTMTADLEDTNGLSSYAITQSETAPETTSNEWIDLSTTAKSNVVRTSIITTKSIEYMVKKNGTYYLHVKNSKDEVVSKSFVANASGENAVDKIVGLAATNTNELRIDEHAATGQQTFTTKEYRYYGTTPNNYVWFNNELWRIIGAMDVDDGTGTVDKRLKIIRTNSIGKYSWDTSELAVNSGTGVNEWTQSDLMKLLNSGAYYNRTTGTCYNGEANASVECDFSNNGLLSEAKEMIGDAKWYLGTYGNPDVTSSKMYELERGTISGKQCSPDDNQTSSEYCNDVVERKTFWVGKIGLMYPTDFGYSADMSSCSATNLSGYSSSCTDTTWLKDSSYTIRWTITPAPQASYADHAYAIGYDGDLGAAGTHYGVGGISPVTYLKSNIKILDGEGTSERPFVLSK